MNPELCRPGLGDPGGLPDPPQPVLGLLPGRIVDDPEIRDLGDEPVGLGIEPGDALAGAGVLHVLQSVPDQAADVELVVQDSGAAQGMAPDRGVAPGPAPGPGDLVGVEAMGN